MAIGRPSWLLCINDDRPDINPYITRSSPLSPLCASANQTSLRVRLIVALSLEHRSKRSNQSELNKNLLWVVSKWADKKLRQLSGDVYDVYWGITLFCDYKKRATESGIQCEFWWY
ncbi:hypothetical protein F4703DRAFT_1799296 [Phycomyces blakesleeanus]